LLFQSQAWEASCNRAAHEALGSTAFGHEGGHRSVAQVNDVRIGERVHEADAEPLAHFESLFLLPRNKGMVET
jgi:hypothetical protein